MSATLFGSMTMAVKRAAVAAPVAAVAAAAASPPRRSMSGDGKTTDGKTQVPNMKWRDFELYRFIQ